MGGQFLSEGQEGASTAGLQTSQGALSQKNVPRQRGGIFGATLALNPGAEDFMGCRLAWLRRLVELYLQLGSPLACREAARGQVSAVKSLCQAAQIPTEHSNTAATEQGLGFRARV